MINQIVGEGMIRIKPRLCIRHLLRLENPCCPAEAGTILALDILMNMPAGQNRSNCAFRNGFLRLATMPYAQSGLKGLKKFLLTLFKTPQILTQHTAATRGRVIRYR